MLIIEIIEIILVFVLWCLVWCIGAWLFFYYNTVVNQYSYTKYDWATFDDFIRVFEEVLDDYKIEYGEIYTEKFDGKMYYSYLPSGGNQLFDKKNFIWLRKDEIIFIKHCMLLDPISYLKYRIWLRKRTKVNRRIVGLWKEGNDNAFTS